jgi:hypothetical protein
MGIIPRSRPPIHAPQGRRRSRPRPSHPRMLRGSHRTLASDDVQASREATRSALGHGCRPSMACLPSRRADGTDRGLAESLCPGVSLDVTSPVPHAGPSRRAPPPSADGHPVALPEKCPSPRRTLAGIPSYPRADAHDGSSHAVPETAVMSGWDASSPGPEVPVPESESRGPCRPACSARAVIVDTRSRSLRDGVRLACAAAAAGRGKPFLPKKGGPATFLRHRRKK